MAAPPVRKQRAREAFELPGATRFSDNPELKNPTWLIQEIRKVPEIWDDLERDTTDPDTYDKRKTGHKAVVGRDRMPGHWGLVGCAWLLSRSPDIQFFHHTRSDSSLWSAAGFESVPSYAATWERLTELEHFVPGYVRATGKLWRLAMHHDERVGRHVWIDATAYESHSRLYHACTDPRACLANGGGQMRDSLERVDIAYANEKRQEEAAEAPDISPTGSTAPDRDPWDDQLEAIAEEVEADADAAESLHPKYRRRRRARVKPAPREIFIRNGKKDRYRHRYICADGDAGFRIYENQKTGRKKTTWTGGLELKATDIYTGAVICSLHIPADQAEFKHYQELLDRVREILGRYPEAVAGDRGYNVEFIRKLNERLGIGDVFPFRKPNQTISERELMRIEGVVDEYGFNYCKHCGSPTIRVRHERDKRTGKGYVRARCANPHTDACRTQLQSFACSIEPRLLGVLGRDELLYHQLRVRAKSSERAHRSERQRYSTGGKNVDTRPKMVGVAVMELRARISHFLTIFRVCLRQGWLGNLAKQNRRHARKLPGGERGLRALQRLRRMKGLLLPQGPKARELGLVFEGEVPNDWPPSTARPPGG